MFKLAIATLFLVGSIQCQGVKTAAASNSRSYFVNPNPRSVALRQSGQTQVAASSFHPAAARPRPQIASSASGTVGSAVRSDLPTTSFTCQDKPYIPGIYADVEANCEVYHVCTPNYTYSFACGEGSGFSQKDLTCNYFANFSCPETKSHYASTAGIGIETGVQTPAVQKTSFTCVGKPYAHGLYADLETNCATYHVCNGEEQFDLNCGEGTFFNQEKLTCDYKNEFDCQASPNFYSSNAGIGVAQQ